jgi:hypothetical protein
VTNQASVRPEKWRETVNGKLGRAHEHWYELCQSESPEWNRYFEGGTYATHLVVLARGVYQVTETLVGNLRPWPWYDAWLELLSPEERTLWRAMRQVRVAEEHGEGADLVSCEVPITRGLEGQQTFTNYAVLGIPRSDRPGIAKFTVRFRPYPDRPASEIARAYIDLCTRFANDFERDHQHLFQGSTP